MLSLKQKISLTLFIFICILGLAIFLFIIPTHNSLKTLKQTINQKNSELNLNKAQNHTAKQNQKLLAFFQKEYENFSKIIIKKENELEVIETFEKIAKDLNIEHNLTFQQTISNNHSGSKSYIILPLNISFNSFYADFLNYLLALDRLPYQLDIQKITLAKIELPKDNDEAEKLKDKIYAEIKIYTYWEAE